MQTLTHTHTQTLSREEPHEDGYPDLTLVSMLSRTMQMTLAMTPWQAVMATHQGAGLWQQAGDWEGGGREGGKGE